MTLALEQTASELTLTPDELQRRSLEAFLERERRLAQLDMADLQDRYGVATSAELAQRIELGQVHSHPAWEEMIEWERLEAYIVQLNEWQAELD